ncbi:MAG: hypothetical protein U5J98_07275 [Halobacteriales archaeon]|nr:hypothetical protein [Halobacteriales archaeon]
MNDDQDRDLQARLAELEATVRGLTQELVSAEERIRQLEAALEEEEAVEDAEPATKASVEEREPESEAPSEEAAEGNGADLDDIIVA